MSIDFFGHPLNPRALGTPPGCKSAKFCSGQPYRELCTTKWHLSYAHFTFQENSDASQVFVLRFGLFFESLETL